MRISKSAILNRPLPRRASIAVQGGGEPHRLTDSFSPRRCDWPGVLTPAIPTPLTDKEVQPGSKPAELAPPFPNKMPPYGTATAGSGQVSQGNDRAGLSTQGREVFAAWLVALLGAALAVLLLASHQTSTSDLRLPQWSDPPIAGAASWADDPLAGRDGNSAWALGGSGNRSPR
jgi:hypothetical protein